MPAKSKFRMLICLLILLMVSASQVFSESAQMWDNMTPGSYEVGFKTIEKYDNSRVFRAKTDFFGELLEGNRARPIQICYWYPAVVGDDELAMTYGEYNFPYPQNDEFIDLLSTLQNRELQAMFALTGGGGPVSDAMNAGLAAVMDAPEAEGQFPVILYLPDLNGSYCENAVLCEFIASHGFIVATTPSIGTSSVRAQSNTADQENQIRDKEIALAIIKNIPGADPNKLALIGYGTGGLGAVNLQMRNSDVDAVVSLSGLFVQEIGLDVASNSPSVNFMRANVPILQMYGDYSSTDFSFLDSMKYAQKYNLNLLEFRNKEFTHYAMLSTMYTGDRYEIPRMFRDGYKLVCEYSLNFLNAYLKDNQDAHKFLQAAVTDNGFDSELAVITRQDKEQLPPTPEQFLGIIEAGKVDFAYDLFEKCRESDPDLILFPEAPQNMLGYQYLQNGQIAEAEKILLMNAETYPKSCNVWDSLSDVYIAAGKNEKALEAVKKALEVLPDDENSSEQLKEMIRNGCQQKLSQLEN